MLSHIRRYNQGFTLIEVLISVVIMAVGVLGNAALQTSALKFTQSANQRGEAVTLAYDMSDRIRANIAEIESYVGTISTADYTAGLFYCSQDESAVVTAADCTSSQMVQYDQWRWTSNVTTTLPSGKAQITRNKSLDESAWLYLITVQWKDKGTSDMQNFTLVLQV